MEVEGEQQTGPFENNDLVVGMNIYKPHIGLVQQVVGFGQRNHMPVKAGEQLIF